MRWEALALAVFSQALQAGLKAKTEPFVPIAPAPSVWGSESHCYCSCFCDQNQELGLAVIGGSVIGAVGASCLCWCGSQPRLIEPSPSHRRRGHGIVSQPYAWTDFGSFLR